MALYNTVGPQHKGNSTNMSDWLLAKEKTINAKQYREYATVPLGEDDDGEPVTADLSYRMLPEEDLMDVIPRIDMEALGGDSDEASRLQELQAKEGLTEEEEQELQGLHEELKANQSEVMNELGPETFHAVIDAGRMALAPDDEDIQMALSQSASEQKDRFGNPVRTREEAKEAIETEMNEVVTGSPYLIKFTVGKAALNTSHTVQGNA